MKSIKLISIILFLTLFSNTSKAHTPTWTDGIACIIYSHCTSCHNPKGIAPFSLTRYEDVFANRFSIAASVQAGSMPPFPPSQQKRKYAHANTLSQHEKEEIVEWVNNFAPLGNASNIPAPPVYNSSFQISAPDLVLQIPNYTVNTTNDLYRVFVLPLNNPDQRFIKQIEIVPGNRSIVHHALVFQDSSSLPLQLDNSDPLPGYSAFGSTGSPSSKLITGYTPGQGVVEYPPGFGASVLPRSYICLQIHYPGGISNKIDSTQVRIKFGSNTLRNITTVAALNHSSTLLNGPLFIPANTIKTFYSKIRVPTNRTITGVMPHMHLLGKKIKSFCVTPRGDTIHLIDIPEWDFHWQGFYTFQKPILIPAGSELFGEATYDNTTANIHNPNSPPRDVRQGEGTDDEMMLIYFNLAAYAPGDTSIIVDTSTHITHHNNCDPNNISVDPNEISIYPNPSDGQFTIEGITGGFDIVMYSSNGQEVFEKKNLNGKSVVTAKSLSAGTYYIEIITEKKLRFYKIIVLN
jgi:hypothetical protein